VGGWARALAAIANLYGGSVDLLVFAGPSGLGAGTAGYVRCDIADRMWPAMRSEGDISGLPGRSSRRTQ
jgi:hypothetical protein